jgi:uncharacterized ion transporter superfamily protein YfcC
MQTPSDTQLHELARKRVDFRRHLTVYLIINATLWLIWSVTGQGYIWPVWPMAGWGIGVLFHYVFDYRSSRFLSEEEEYEKLKKEIKEHEHIAQ